MFLVLESQAYLNEIRKMEGKVFVVEEVIDNKIDN